MCAIERRAIFPFTLALKIGHLQRHASIIRRRDDGEEGFLRSRRRRRRRLRRRPAGRRWLLPPSLAPCPVRLRPRKMSAPPAVPLPVGVLGNYPRGSVSRAAHFCVRCNPLEQVGRAAAPVSGGQTETDPLLECPKCPPRLVFSR